MSHQKFDVTDTLIKVTIIYDSINLIIIKMKSRLFTIAIISFLIGIFVTHQKRNIDQTYENERFLNSESTINYSYIGHQLINILEILVQSIIVIMCFVCFALGLSIIIRLCWLIMQLCWLVVYNLLVIVGLQKSNRRR